MKISKKMAQSTAASVINRHRTLSADQATPPHPVQPVSKNHPNRSFPGHPHLFLESAHAKKLSEGKGEDKRSILTRFLFSLYRCRLAKRQNRKISGFADESFQYYERARRIELARNSSVCPGHHLASFIRKLIIYCLVRFAIYIAFLFYFLIFV